MPTHWRPRARFALMVLCATLAGCGGIDPLPQLHPVTGTVTRDGKPVAAGGLIFIPDPGQRSRLVVNAAVRPDGSFTAQTERVEGDTSVARPGVPAGTYKVVFHPPGDGSKTDLAVELKDRATVGPGATTLSLVLPPESPGAGKPEPERKGKTGE